MIITRHPVTEMLQVVFHPQIRRDEFVLKDPCGNTVGTEGPCGIAKDNLDMPMPSFRLPYRYDPYKP